MAFVSKSYTKRVKLYPHPYTPLLTVLPIVIKIDPTQEHYKLCLFAPYSLVKPRFKSF